MVIEKDVDLAEAAVASEVIEEDVGVDLAEVVVASGVIEDAEAAAASGVIEDAEGAVASGVIKDAEVALAAIEVEDVVREDLAVVAGDRERNLLGRVNLYLHSFLCMIQKRTMWLDIKCRNRVYYS